MSDTTSNGTSDACSSALRLPRSAVLTDALLEPSVSGPSGQPIDQVERKAMQDAFVGSLGAAVARLPEADKLLVTRRHLRLVADRGPLFTEPEEEFVISPAKCRRAIGLGAVERCVRGRSANPADAVSDLLRDVVDEVSDGSRGSGRGAWWSSWYVSAPDSAKAVVRAEATTWATQLWTSLQWERLPRPVFVGGGEWWSAPGAPNFVLRGDIDVRVKVADTTVLFVLANGTSGSWWNAELLFPAVVAALGSPLRALPSRVVGYWPCSGQWRSVDVTAGSLRSAVETLSSVVVALVDVRHK